MTTDELLNQMCWALNLPDGKIGLDDTNRSVPEWDSIGHLSLISMLERNFGAVVEDEELRIFTSVRELVDRLHDRNLLEESVASH